MTMTINGSGTITGLTAGGLPDATITQPDLATGVAGTGPAFSAKGTAVSVSGATQTKLTTSTTTFDTNSNYASSRFTPTVAGYYQINASAASASSATGYVLASIYKNGSLYFSGTVTPNSSIGPNVCVASLVYCNGSTDYIEIYAYQTSGGSLNITLNDFSGALVRAA